MYPYLFSFDVDNINNIEDLYREIDNIKDTVNSYKNKYQPHWFIDDESTWYFGCNKYGKYMIYTPIVPNPIGYDLDISSISPFASLGGKGISYISVDQMENDGGVPFLDDTLSSGILPKKVKSYTEKDYMEDRNNAIENGILSRSTLAKYVGETELVNFNKFMNMIGSLNDKFTDYYSNNYIDVYPSNTDEWYLHIANKDDIYLNVPLYGIDENTVNKRMLAFSDDMNLRIGSFTQNNIIHIKDLPRNVNLSKYIRANISSKSQYEDDIMLSSEYGDIVNTLVNMSNEKYLDLINLVNRKKFLNGHDDDEFL
ncbi:Hypothetical protein ORPV_1157 [Orpheovirus IHUMI-LCC2]|uniref:Uncharacterized protein n=1 Tax=Orpheovirus IHUMI-LCC2 TaxID=2023057 RepID=A0A2I2L6C3_9VIRU|nr:Hypothetical protein ORPV_1157 [Orpheovirus IHUMI-LCC2]SNW63061.1 Hypothetical protein ORPV_1157 [Orpheovirus IHUMI-LCC2]